MGLSSYLTYTVTSLELGDITNDHTQLDWVTRAKVPRSVSGHIHPYLSELRRDFFWLASE